MTLPTLTDHFTLALHAFALVLIALGLWWSGRREAREHPDPPSDGD
mgnify:CR=1 FL=1